MIPELRLNQEEPELAHDSDSSTKSSKSANPDSPGHVLKIVESWEGNIDEYHLPGRGSKSPASGGHLESPRSESSGGESSPRSGSHGHSSDNPWQPSAFKTAPQPLPGMVKPSVYSLARNINLDPDFVPQTQEDENLYECVAPLSAGDKKAPTPYDPPWSDEYTDPTNAVKGSHSHKTPKEGNTGKTIYS